MRITEAQLRRIIRGLVTESAGARAVEDTAYRLSGMLGGKPVPGDWSMFYLPGTMGSGRPVPNRWSVSLTPDPSREGTVFVEVSDSFTGSPLGSQAFELSSGGIEGAALFVSEMTGGGI